MSTMLKFFLLINIFLLQCCAINSGVCRLAPPGEGWEHIEKKPLNIELSNKPKSGYYYEWFSNNDGLYLRCERSWRGPGCMEEAIFYNSASGARSEDEGFESLMLVCGM